MSRLAKNKLLTFAVILVAIQLILAIGAPLFAPFDPMAQSVARRLRAPSELNWFGTDQLGRDVLTRILYGYRTSLIACLPPIVPRAATPTRGCARERTG